MAENFWRSTSVFVSNMTVDVLVLKLYTISTHRTESKASVQEINNKTMWQTLNNLLAFCPFWDGQ